MKTRNIQLLLALLSSSLLWLAFTQPTVHLNESFQACVTDEAGAPLLYVDIVDSKGTWLAETDVNGCFALPAGQSELEIALRFPGYEQRSLALNAGEATTITMLKIVKLPPVYQSTGVVYPTKSHGEYEIRGTVEDDGGEPLIGASILIQGTTRGTVTDLDGSFVLQTDKKCVDVLISYTGYESQEQKDICTGKAHRFRLEEGIALDEVVVTGMGVKRRHAARTMSLSISDSASPAPPPPPPSPAAYEPAPTMALEAETSKFREVAIEADYSAEAVTEVSGGEGAMMRKGVRADEEAEAKDLPTAGQLTAGEVNDFSKWEMWSDINQEDLAMHRSTWKQYADHRYTLQLTNPSGSAVVNAIATLKDGQGNALWQARTDAQGRAEMWAHYFREVETAANGLSIEVEYEGKRVTIPNAKPFKEGINFQTLGVDCREDAIVDVAFVVDATGSMSDEISYLQAELLDVIGRVREGLPGVDLQMGSVFYRDENEEYLTRVQPFTPDAPEAIKFLEQQQAMGGGDYPEAVEAALESALDELAWRDDASTRLLFLVLDAPPHQAEENIKRMQVAVTKAAMEGIQIIPVSCSGVDKSTEYLLRSMALATNGTYTFITDHSGIGNAHIEPSTDSYEVEFLNDVLVRLTIERSKLSTCNAPVAEVELPEAPTPAERNWEYYPNPTSGPLSLRFPDTEGTLYLADAHGKLLLQRPANAQFDMNLSTYPAGTYWLRHQSAEGEWTQGQVLLLRR